MIIFLVRLKSIQLFTRLAIPAQAIVPKSKSIIPPNTALGIDFNNALILPITENKIAETATDYSDRPLEEQRMKKVTVELFGETYDEPETV